MANQLQPPSFYIPYVEAHISDEHIKRILEVHYDLGYVNFIDRVQKFDADGEYIRKWVPEISNLSDKEIHFPSKRNNYPEAMIDLSFSRNRALAIYRNI
jgi:hypothetical protein